MNQVNAKLSYHAEYRIMTSFLMTLSYLADWLVTLNAVFLQRRDNFYVLMTVLYDQASNQQVQNDNLTLLPSLQETKLQEENIPPLVD